MSNTPNYYFDCDERDYTVKPPKLTPEEIDEINNNDENWFEYMMKKDTCVELYNSTYYGYYNNVDDYDLYYEDEDGESESENESEYE